MVRAALHSSSARLAGGEIVEGNRATRVEAGTWMTSARDVGDAVVATRDGTPILVRDVAEIADGDGEADVEEYVEDDMETQEPSDPWDEL